MPPSFMHSDMGFTPYTEHPTADPTIIFPNHGLQALCTTLNLIGITLVTWALSRRTQALNLFESGSWKESNWPRICTILVFLDSWGFIFTSGILISGTGLSLNSTTCMLGIYSCIVLYASGKVLIYAFLIEKVWIVWSHSMANNLTRLKSTVWRVCMVLGLFPFVGVLLLMFIGRIGEIRRNDGVCIIGLQRFASLPLLSFDLFITFFLTALFVYPLHKGISPRLREVALRNLASSGVALATSCVNIAVLTFLHGRELGWICLTSCAADVTINGMVLFWVTSQNDTLPPLNENKNLRKLLCEECGRANVNPPATPTTSSGTPRTDDTLASPTTAHSATSAHTPNSKTGLSTRASFTHTYGSGPLSGVIIMPSGNMTIKSETEEETPSETASPRPPSRLEWLKDALGVVANVVKGPNRSDFNSGMGVQVTMHTETQLDGTTGLPRLSRTSRCCHADDVELELESKDSFRTDEHDCDLDKGELC